MATFVLIHGAMHGAWCWRFVKQSLRDAGHRVFAPTLSGMGDRRHLLTRETGLQDHVQDVKNLLFYEDIHDAVIVAHSYGGVVAEQVAHNASQRIGRIVHLHSFVPEDGQCLWDLQPEATRQAYRAAADSYGEGWRLEPDPSFADRWGIPPELNTWVTERLTSFPMKCLFDRVALRSSATAHIPRIYVQQTGEPLRSILRPFEVRAHELGWQVELIDGQHDSMLSSPAAVVTLLERVLGSVP